jgi:hypothetical protein
VEVLGRDAEMLSVVDAVAANRDIESINFQSNHLQTAYVKIGHSFKNRQTLSEKYGYTKSHP